MSTQISPAKAEASMTVSEHLTELRKRLVLSVLSLLGFSVLAFVFIQPFVDLMLNLSEDFSFVYLSPAELVSSYLRLAVVLGLVFSSPVILWQSWAFVSPGLTGSERRSALTAVLAGFAFFLIGALFCYLVVLPMTLKFFYGFNASKDITAAISFQNYMGFVLTMLVVFGIVFEMPVLGYLLAKLGFVKSAWLRKGRKYAILLIFICAAVITPPDVVSQVMTAIPMIGLYELSIYITRMAEKRRPAEEDSPAKTE